MCMAGGSEYTGQGEDIAGRLAGVCVARTRSAGRLPASGLTTDESRVDGSACNVGAVELTQF